MTQSSARDLNHLQAGAVVFGTDYEIGTLESVKANRLLVRHGHADYLLAIPASAMREAVPGRIELNMRREDAELLVFTSDSGAEAGPVIATPLVDEVIGAPERELPDGPATG